MVSAETTRQLLEMHGDLRPQPISDWSGPFDLPNEIEQFYREVGPDDVTIEGYGNPNFFPSLESLWDFQAGYRWNGLSDESLDDWKDEWIVVACEGGDPFIFVQTSGAILHAHCGEGTWNPVPIFSNLNTMAACLSQLGAIVCEYRDEYTDEQCFIRPEYRALAVERFSQLIGTMSQAEKALDRLGWS